MRRIAALPLLLLAACTEPSGGTPPADGGGQTAQSWHLASLNGQAFDYNATFALQPDGRFGGKGPCNMYGGRNSATPPDFRPSAVNSTMMACVDDGAMQAEGQFHTALAAANRIETSPSELTLTGPSVRMVFHPGPAHAR